MKTTLGLLNTNVNSILKYIKWLSNAVLVNNSSWKWRMCTDYTDLNKACFKDSYPLPTINNLVDNLEGYKTFSFIDAYSSYKQIPTYKLPIQCHSFRSQECQAHLSHVDE